MQTYKNTADYIAKTGARLFVDLDAPHTRYAIPVPEGTDEEMIAHALADLHSGFGYDRKWAIRCFGQVKRIALVPPSEYPVD